MATNARPQGLRDFWSDQEGDGEGGHHYPSRNHQGGEEQQMEQMSAHIETSHCLGFKKGIA